MLPGLNVLELYVAVAETGSLASAARRFGISPSVVSRRISQLEQRFNAHLISRTTRQLHLTESGIAVLTWARGVLEGYNELGDQLGELENAASGVVRIASNDHATAYYIPKLLSDFSPRYPNLRYIISSFPDPRELYSDNWDLILHIGARPNIELVGRLIGSYRRFLCVAPSYLSKFGIPSEVADLTHHHCLLHSNNQYNQWHLSSGDGFASIKIDPFIKVDSYITMYELTVAGLGISELSELLVQKDFLTGRLVRVMPPLTGVLPNGDNPGLWLLYPNRKVLYRTRLFGELLAAATRKFYYSGVQFDGSQFSPLPMN